jgi:hypothetical protein
MHHILTDTLWNDVDHLKKSIFTKSYLVEPPHLTKIIVVLILHYAHVFGINASLDLHDQSFNLAFLLEGEGALDLIELLINSMQEPFLVQISIVSIDDKLFVDLAALARHVHVLLWVSHGLDPEVVAIMNDFEVLLGRPCIGLHE